MSRTTLKGMLFIALLPGCDLLFEDEAGPATAATEESGSSQSKNLTNEQLESRIASQESYSYDPYGKRDPFMPFLGEVGSERKSGGGSILQQYDLNEYVLIGALSPLSANPRPYGLVRDPAGDEHVVEIGDYIGKNWGQVSSINRDSIGVKEKFQLNDGDLLVTEKLLRLGGGMGR